MRRKISHSYHYGDLREAVIDKAFTMLREKSVYDLSIRQLAQRLGVSHQAPFSHFKNKEAVYGALIEKGFNEIAQGVHHAILKFPNDASLQLRMAGREYIRFVEKNPRLMEFMFSGIEQGQNRKSINIAKKLAFDNLQQIMKNGATQKVFISQDISAMTFVAWNFIHGFSHLIVSKAVKFTIKKNKDEFINEQFDIFLNGFLCKKEKK